MPSVTQWVLGIVTFAYAATVVCLFLFLGRTPRTAGPLATEQVGPSSPSETVLVTYHFHDQLRYQLETVRLQKFLQNVMTPMIIFTDSISLAQVRWLRGARPALLVVIQDFETLSVHLRTSRGQTSAVNGTTAWTHLQWWLLLQATTHYNVYWGRLFVWFPVRQWLLDSSPLHIMPNIIHLVGTKVLVPVSQVGQVLPDLLVGTASAIQQFVPAYYTLQETRPALTSDELLAELVHTVPVYFLVFAFSKCGPEPFVVWWAWLTDPLSCAYTRPVLERAETFHF